MTKFSRLINIGYYVCDSWQYIVRTGLFTSGMKVTKTTLKFPGQLITYVNMHPVTYQFDIHNMSKEKVKFRLPMIFTVCPIDPETDLQGFMNYALKTHNTSQENIRATIGGIVEGKTRTFTAEMTIEEMFSSKEAFKSKVIDKIGEDLHKIGLTIINTNIREMSDYNDNNKYFDCRKQRAIETVNYQAKVDVSIAKKDGEIGVEARERDIRIVKAQNNKESIAPENESLQKIANSEVDFNEIQAENKHRSELATINANLKNDAKVIERMADAEYYRKSKEVKGIKRIFEADAEDFFRLLHLQVIQNWYLFIFLVLTVIFILSLPRKPLCYGKSSTQD